MDFDGLHELSFLFHLKMLILSVQVQGLEPFIYMKINQVLNHYITQLYSDEFCQFMYLTSCYITLPKELLDFPRESLEQHSSWRV